MIERKKEMLIFRMRWVFMSLRYALIKQMNMFARVLSKIIKGKQKKRNGIATIVKM